MRDQLGVSPKHVGQHVRQILQQMKPIGHLADRGRPRAGGFRIRLGAIPDKHLDPGMRLQPLGHGPASRSGSRATGRRRSRSNRLVP